MPNRRDFLRSAGLGALSGCLGWAQAQQPNVVVMLASSVPDLTLDPVLRVPNLTRFSEESFQFERAYVPCPETGPSQAALITGRFPYVCGVPRDGVPLPADQTTVGTILKDFGYRTAIFGDWRLGGSQDGGETESAIHFIKRNRRNPFFVLVAWHRMDAAVMDNNAGQLLAAIDDFELKNGTIVVFTSDHGYGSGPLESAVRVPFMLRFPPRIEPERRAGVAVSTVDLAPTLVSLCGLPPPHSMQGSDLARGPSQSIYSAGRLETPGEWHMVVRGLDKLVMDRERNVTGLYNLGADPEEVNNRARDPELALKRDELKALLSDWIFDGMVSSGLKRRARVEQ